MAATSKGRIRHIAISVPDPWAAAAFYKAAFGLDEVGETDGKLAEGVFLTDGVVNIALLKFKTDEAAQGTGKDFVGLHHVGFWVDDAIASGDSATRAGAAWIMGDPHNKGGYEVKYTDPDGVIFDISEDGWDGTQKSPGQPDNALGPKSRTRVARFDERRARAEAEIASRLARETEAAE
jgi:catechol 2,3-dioxygenase-like lactoylglutathione lyase family enzyme